MQLLFCLLIFVLAIPARAQTTDPLADPAQGEVIGLVYGVDVQGALGDAAPEVVYSFDGLRGEIVTVSLTVTVGDLDPMLTIVDSDGVVVAHSDDASGQRGVRLESLRIPRSDRYRVIVGRFGYSLGTTSGGFTLLLERIGVSSASGSALRYGDSVINQITDMTPQVYYSFRARRGDIINIVMQRISGSLDTYLQLVDANAFVIADNDDVTGSGSLDAEISGLLIEADGTYVIIASRFGQAAGDSTGGFFLQLTEAADSGLGNSLAAALPLPDGAPMEGEVTAERFATYYRFDARANEIVSVRMERLSGSVDALLVLMNAAGVEIASNDDTEGSQNAAIADFLIPSDGAYIVVATRFEREAGQTTGRYRLTFERGGSVFQDVPQDTRFIPYGSTITGNIDDAIPEQRYAFYGTQGDAITVAMTRGDGDLDPLVAILDASGAPLASNDDSDGSQNARIDRFTLPATGVYYIQATRYTGEGRSNTRGSYILVLAQRFD